MEVINLNQLSMAGNQMSWLRKQLLHRSYTKTTKHISVH